MVGSEAAFFRGCVMLISDVCSFLIWCVDMKGSRDAPLSWSRFFLISAMT